MLSFKQKEYSEYPSTRLLYSEIQKRHIRGIDFITRSEMIPILRGNNIIIEKFTISTSLFGKDHFRAYFKMGAKVSMPNDVYIPNSPYSERRTLGKLEMNMQAGIKPPNYNDNNNNKGQDNRSQNTSSNQSSNNNSNSNNGGRGNGRGRNHSRFSLTSDLMETERFFSELCFEERMYAKTKGGGNGGPPNFISTKFIPYVDLSYNVDKPLAETISYDKNHRTLVLEFETMDNVLELLTYSHSVLHIISTYLQTNEVSS